MTGLTRTGIATEARLGLRADAGQFALLVGVNGLVGGMLGQERTVLPLLARHVFGVTKAIANLVAGALADRYGRKPVLVAGWLLAVPVPLLLIWAPPSRAAGLASVALASSGR